MISSPRAPSLVRSLALVSVLIPLALAATLSASVASAQSDGQDNIGGGEARDSAPRPSMGPAQDQPEVVPLPVARFAIGPGFLVGLPEGAMVTTEQLEIDAALGVRVAFSRASPFFSISAELGYTYHDGLLGGHGLTVGTAALFGNPYGAIGPSLAFVAAQVGPDVFAPGVRAGLRGEIFSGIFEVEVSWEGRYYEGNEVHMVRLMFATELIGILLAGALTGI